MELPPTVSTMFGMECVIYMGAEDTKRQALNVFRMELQAPTLTKGVPAVIHGGRPEGIASFSSIDCVFFNTVICFLVKL
ncbi:hypothetical protein B5G50_22225 [Brevibacillus brevis]|nr:hypothetical protein B5G50_22225 [Brevibacillus brevis]